MVACLVIASVTSAQVVALQSSSSNYILNSNAASTFGGSAGSGDYQLFASGGEAIIGDGAGGSYMLGAGFVEQLQNSIQMSVQPSGLVRHYTLDEVSGTEIKDRSALNVPATLYGDEVASVSGKLAGAFGKSTAAYEWADPAARITAPVPQLDKLTVSVWFKAATLGGWSNLVGYSPNEGHSWGPWELYTDSNAANALQWSVATTGGVQRLTADNISLDEWHLATATYDSATGLSELYIDGERRAHATYTPSTIDYSSGNIDGHMTLFNSLRWPDEGFRGALDHVKIFDRVLSSSEIAAEYSAQNDGLETGLGLGVVVPGASQTVAQDVIVRTDSAAYGVAVSQDHPMQQGAHSIAAIGGSIASPLTWSEGVTKGLGFTVVDAPQLESKWELGAKYAGFPSAATIFYSRTGHTGIDAIDVIKGRIRLDVPLSQPSGDYAATVTYTGTLIP